MTMPQVLDPEDVNQVIQRYRRRIAEHGVTFASLNSGSEEKQAMRQWVHASALRGERPSILEVGCGLGDFYKYLIAQKQDCTYHGYDIVPEYIAQCQSAYPQATHPETRFEVRNIFLDGINGIYDTVLMSQVLNNRYEKSDNMQVMRRALELAFQHTRVSVSVDMLSTYVDFRNPDLFYYSPEEIFSMAKAIAPRVVIRHDYRAFEFCVQLFHQEAEGYLK
ncbi:MAG TPA: class I SAM-dependent methyltransferase [Candidatus Sulfotelmatobacter sp.]|jgi:SAM-dependent methyltransferase